ncbi:MAG: HVO_0476 family zinc finger protein, partial [Halobacteria archaeon]|nr:HVO_0476 family zinc finger protein [Halobacteria archaeon]
MTQTDGDEGIGEAVADCPSCGTRTRHTVLKTNGLATVECNDCGHVHKVKVDEPDEVERRVVVSDAGEDFSTTVSLRADERLRVGEEFVLETDEGVFGVEVTSLEVHGSPDEGDDNRRVDYGDAEEIDVIWTKVVDNVVVPLTLHTEGGRSESHEMRVPGDYRFEVGEVETVDGDDFVVTAFMTESGD